MDMNEMIVQLKSNLTPTTVILVVLLIASEVLGSVDSVKASSIYQVIKSVLLSIKEQIMPVKPQA